MWFQIWHEKFGDFSPIHSKVQKFYFSGLFILSYLWWHWTVMQNLNKPRPCGFKNDTMNWMNFDYSTQKSENCTLMDSFCPKHILFQLGKFQRNYVSWHWRVLQSFNENWLVAWKMTYEIWLVFMQAVESLKTCTLIGSVCPKHTNI